MTNNDIIRRLRYALDLSNPKLAEVFRLSGHELSRAELLALLQREGEEGYRECGDALLRDFLNGLIVLRRGPREGGGDPPATRDPKLDNNEILKMIRIALELKEADLLAILKTAGYPASRSEVSALFRTRGHENFKQCGDQLLRNFLKGVTLKFRGADPGEKGSPS